MWMGILIGTAFGFFLEKAGVLNPDAIVGQLQWRRFTMLRVFLSAIITGLIVFWVFDALGYEHLNWKCTKVCPDILGGALLGIGMVFAGSCPGTVFGQIGIGYKDAWFTLLGGLAGAWTYLQYKDQMLATMSDWPNKFLSFPDLCQMSFHVTTALFVLGFSLFLFLTRKLPS